MMKLQKLIGLMALAVLILGCSKDDEEEKLDFGPCDCGNSTVETVSQQVGQVRYDDELDKYALYWAIPGTIDSKKVYFMCQVSSRFKQEGKQVRFSGEAKDPCKIPTNRTGSQQFFDIRLTQLEEI